MTDKKRNNRKNIRANILSLTKQNSRNVDSVSNSPDPIDDLI